MVTILDVAHWFLSKQSMRYGKLETLCYYAQAWYCALYDGAPLFEDEFLAWQYGPGNPLLNSIYAKTSWQDIPQDTDFDSTCFDDKAIKVLKAVYKTYGDLTEHELEDLVCSESPWKEGMGNLELWGRSAITISRTSMREYYFAKYISMRRKAKTISDYEAESKKIKELTNEIKKLKAENQALKTFFKETVCKIDPNTGEARQYDYLWNMYVDEFEDYDHGHI